MELDARIMAIIREELTLAEERISERIESIFLSNGQEDADGFASCVPVNQPKPPFEGGSYADDQKGISRRAFPNPEKYQVALEIYQTEKNHSRVARELGITINAAKKYYTWLVKNGYLPSEEAELSDTELKVVHCIFEKGMSLTATAKELQCSVTNIVRRRDSAISKGYAPPVQEAK